MDTLRDYQTDLVQAIRSSLAQGNKAPLAVLPTGGGKTHVAAHIIRATTDAGNTALFLAPRRELVYQTRDKLTRVGVEHGIIMAGEPANLYAPVQVACGPTLHRRAITGDRLPLPRAKLVIVDEAHLSIANSTKTIIERYREQGAVIIGLTATPCRADGAGLGQVYDDLVEGPSVAELVNQKHLVPARYFTGEAPDLDGIKTTAGEYNQKQLGERVNRVQLVGDIVSNWARLAPDRQTFVFAVNVAHSMHLRDEFLRIGVRAEHLDGGTPNDERHEILERLRSGETQVLVNCEVMTYGVDFPPVSCIVLAKPTKSIARYFQMVGRGLRTWPGKVDCLVLDHAQAVQNIGFVDDPMPWTLDGSDKVQDRVKRERKTADEITCGDCGATFRPAKVCPSCGAEQGQRYAKAIEAHEAELREIDRKRNMAETRVWTLDDKARFFSELKHIAQERGYKPAWAAHQYRNKTGSWPNPVRHVAPAPPSLATKAWVRSQLIRFAKSGKSS